MKFSQPFNKGDLIRVRDGQSCSFRTGKKQYSMMDCEREKSYYMIHGFRDGVMMVMEFRIYQHNLELGFMTLLIKDQIKHTTFPLTPQKLKEMFEIVRQ